MEYFTRLSPASETYHSRYACSQVPPDVRRNSNWKIAADRPDGIDECPECRAWTTGNRWAGRGTPEKRGNKERPG